MNLNKFVIADIHGCLHSLKELLNTIGLSKADEIYFLGDYVDRGPYSKEVIDFLMNLKNSGYQVRMLCGNHEHMMLEEIIHANWPGGPPETIKSFGLKHLKDIDIKYINWLKNLELYIEVDNFILVHGGLNFNLKNPLEDDYDLLWVRDWYKNINYNWLGERIIVHGHTPIETYKISKLLEDYKANQYLNLDNGCVYKEEGLGHLACLNLKNMELIFQNNIDGFYKD